MMANANMIAVEAIGGETLDQLVWRKTSRASPVVEQVMQANPNLADAGPFLQAGQVVHIPANAHRTAPVPLIQLWS